MSSIGCGKSIEILLFLVVACTLVGCDAGGPKTYMVRGRVVLEDGKSIEMGSVEFRSEAVHSRVIARGKINQDGSFALSTFLVDDGAVAGRHEVIVQQMIISEGIGSSHQHGPRVSARYSEYSTSGLNIEIAKADDNFVTLVLEKTTP